MGYISAQYNNNNNNIKISAVHYLVLSQPRMWQTDRRTDKITTPQAALAYARTVINNKERRAVSLQELIVLTNVCVENYAAFLEIC